MTKRSRYDHRYRGLLTFQQNDTYKGFKIERSSKQQKAGEGPYRVMFAGKDIYQSKYNGDCKYHVEEIVEAYRKLTIAFTKKWKLARFPKPSEI